MFLFHHSSQVEPAPVTEPDPIGNAVPRADILERKGLAFAGLFFALLLWIALSVSLPAYAGFVPKLSDQRFSSQLADMTEEYDKDVTRQQAARNPYINERLIVKSYDTLNPEEYGAVDAIRDRDGHYILQFASSAAARRAEKRLEQRESTIYVEPDYPMFAQDMESYDAQDSYMLQAQEAKSWGVGYTSCDQYAASLTGSQGTVKVAVLDTGIRTTHEMFRGRLSLLNQSTAAVSDVQGHGTAVAGVVADSTDGLSQIQIVPVRVLDGSGTGDSSTVAARIREISGKVQVINLSLVSETQSTQMLLLEEIRDAVRAGSVVVIAAGNQNESALNQPPANIKDTAASGVVVVGGCNRYGKPYYNSNFGESVDLSAPGEEIYCASKDGDQKYAYKTGTSFSAPCVSAAAAMLLLNNRSLKPAEIEKLLEQNVKSFSGSVAHYYGTGILELKAAAAQREAQNEAERKAAAEAQRKAQEAALAEAQRKAQEAALAEAQRKAQEAARAEAERKAQEAAKAEAERKAAEAKLLASKPYANVEDLVPLKKKQRTDRLKVMGLTGGDCVISWNSSDAGKVMVSGNPDGSCIVTAGRKTGKAVITATCKSGKTVTFRIKVQKKKVRTRKIRIPSKKVSIAAGQSLELDVQPFPITSVDKVEYTSKNPGVVRVDASGILTAKAPGDAVVVVKSGSKKVKVKVTVY